MQGDREVFHLLLVLQMLGAAETWSCIQSPCVAAGTQVHELPPAASRNEMSKKVAKKLVVEVAVSSI